MNAVSNLAKEDLSEMAESLIYLTYLKRRITFAEESVGGPVDVAVISKGDGFVWIKRKHYFRPELNQHFSTTILKYKDMETLSFNTITQIIHILIKMSCLHSKKHQKKFKHS
ncbi:MAG: hypothetical protein IPK46_10755 [Saprospiraceae bacterium]|nr:hypothetical protein [Saprospiraceae bacterium]